MTLPPEIFSDGIHVWGGLGKGSKGSSGETLVDLDASTGASTQNPIAGNGGAA